MWWRVRRACSRHVRESRARTCTLVLLLLYFLYISGINTAGHPLVFHRKLWKTGPGCRRRRHDRRFGLWLHRGLIEVGVKFWARAWRGTLSSRTRQGPNRLSWRRPATHRVTTATPGPTTASLTTPGTIPNPPNCRFALSTHRALLTPVDIRLGTNRSRPRRQGQMGP